MSITLCPNKNHHQNGPSRVGGPLTASLLVRIVAAIVFVVTLLRRVQAPLSIRAPELVQVTRHPGTALLVLATATVHVAVTLFLLWHANISGTTAAAAAAGCGCWSPLWRCTTPDVVRLALSICCMEMEERETDRGSVVDDDPEAIFD